MSTRRAVAFVSVSALVPAALVVACGGDAKTSKTPEPTTSAGSASSSAPEGSASSASSSSATPAASAASTMPGGGSMWGADAGDAPSSGFGNGRGRLGTKPVGPAAISMRHGVTTVTGPLPVEAVDRIVRQMYGHFRFCYDKALAKNPALEGRLSLRITIDKNGAAKAVDGGSDIGDPELVSCAVKTFGNLSFPKTAGETVAIYPLVLSPEGGAAPAASGSAAAPAGSGTPAKK